MNISEINQFAELFNNLRLKAGFETLGQFGNELAKEGFVYEDGIFSKWKRGERVPRERPVLLAIMRVFIKHSAISTLTEANAFLNSVDQRDLNSTEKNEIAHSLVQSDSPYSEYKDIPEPYILPHNNSIPFEDLRIQIIEDITDPQVREYWHYLSNCAVSEYYSKFSGDIPHSHEYFFQKYQHDKYHNHPYKKTLIAVATDSMTRQEYLASTIRIIRGSDKIQPAFDFLNFLGRNKPWPHEENNIDSNKIIELDQFIIPNWASGGMNEIIKHGIQAIQKYMQSNNISMVYALTSSFVREMCDATGIKYEVVDNTYMYALQPDAEIKHPRAYHDYHELFHYWNADPQICIIKI